MNSPNTALDKYFLKPLVLLWASLLKPIRKSLPGLYLPHDFYATRKICVRRSISLPIGGNMSALDLLGMDDLLIPVEYGANEADQGVDCLDCLKWVLLFYFTSTLLNVKSGQLTKLIIESITNL
jgi:hypothetical protein